MPTYRIIINGEPTETIVQGATYMDAYFAAEQSISPIYKKDFKLQKEEPK